MRVLVTGHRGYIGSVMVSMLKEIGIFCIGVDNAHPNFSDYKVDVALTCNVSSMQVIDAVRDHKITHIFHFAASAAIEDSVTNPALYYWNNVGETTKLLGNLHQIGWRGKFIFSSTAAVYGERGSFATENQEKYPCNPYGRSKLMCEQAIEDICHKAGIDAVIFRYFNVAGAYRDAGDHLTSDHILPKICSAIYDKKPFTINGSDYPTRDGTNVRDYVHVMDICRAHLHACDFLGDNPYHDYVYTFNLGSAEGFTNKEIVEAFIKHTGEELEWQYGPNRPGDPAYLVADNTKFIERTGFEYKHTDLEKIVTSAWDWYKKCKTRNTK